MKYMSQIQHRVLKKEKTGERRLLIKSLSQLYNRGRIACRQKVTIEIPHLIKAKLILLMFGQPPPGELHFRVELHLKLKFWDYIQIYEIIWYWVGISVVHTLSTLYERVRWDPCYSTTLSPLQMSFLEHLEESWDPISTRYVAKLILMKFGQSSPFQLAFGWN